MKCSGELGSSSAPGCTCHTDWVELVAMVGLVERDEEAEDETVDKLR